MKLLTKSNQKVEKSIKEGFLTFILHLAPATLSGFETCPKRTAGCTAGCLNTAGHGGMFKKGETTNRVQEARIRRTKMFFNDRENFLALLAHEIRLAQKQAVKLGLTLTIRLNGTSDLSWEKYGIIEQFPTVQFYDYTKIRNRKVKHLPNYHLTFSKADGNDLDVRLALSEGMNVAVVFDKKLPERYLGRQVVNGDYTDLRFKDPVGVVVGLTAKGRAKKDTSGFVVRA
jgi:hypothetical protein